MPGRSWDDLETFFAGVGLEVVRRDRAPGDHGHGLALAGPV